MPDLVKGLFKVFCRRLDLVQRDRNSAFSFTNFIKMINAKCYVQAVNYNFQA